MSVSSIDYYEAKEKRKEENEEEGSTRSDVLDSPITLISEVRRG